MHAHAAGWRTGWLGARGRAASQTCNGAPWTPCCQARTNGMRALVFLPSSHTHTHADMSALVRAVLRRAFQQTRSGSSHAAEPTGPQPPNGFLFGEKVIRAEWISYSLQISRHTAAPAARRDPHQGWLGEHVQLRHDDWRPRHCTGLHVRPRGHTVRFITLGIATLN